MDNLTETTGLSLNNLYVLYDFYPHKFSTENRKMPASPTALLEIACPNPNIFVFNQASLSQSLPESTKKKTGNNVQKMIINKREAELDKLFKQGQITAEEKDRTMVYEFLGWALTSTNHFVYVYCISPSADKSKPEHWKILDKQLLAIFHRRLGKDVSRYYHYSSGHITESLKNTNHLAVDMRYIINRWVNSESEQFMPLIKENSHLFVRNADYLLRQHRDKEKIIMIALKDEEKKNDKKEEEEEEAKPSHKHEDLIRHGIDPYEINDDELCSITGEDYDKLREMPIPSQIRSHFNIFTNVSRRAFLDKNQAPSFYEHDPGILFDQICIATNIEAHAKRSVSQVTRDHLMTVKNNNVAHLIDNPPEEVLNEMKERVEEFIWANMSVEHASRSLPPYIKTKLSQ